MKESNLFDIVRDEALIEALARRVEVTEADARLGSDPLFVDLSAWATSIDHDLEQVLAQERPSTELIEPSPADSQTPEVSGRGGLHRAGRGVRIGEGSLSRAGRRSMRAGFAVAAAGAAMSFCGVAAAVNGGHLPALTSFRAHTPGMPGSGASVLADVPSASATSDPTQDEKWAPDEGSRAKVSGSVTKRGVTPTGGSKTSTAKPGPDASSGHASTPHPTQGTQAPQTGHGTQGAPASTAPRSSTSARTSKWSATHRPVRTGQAPKSSTNGKPTGRPLPSPSTGNSSAPNAPSVPGTTSKPTAPGSTPTSTSSTSKKSSSEGSTQPSSGRGRVTRPSVRRALTTLMGPDAPDQAASGGSASATSATASGK